MRQVGTLPNREEAERFVDYLLTRDISARADEAAGKWEIWVHEENDFQPSKQEFEAFLQDPNDPRYLEARRAAQARRREEAEKAKRARRNVVEMRDRWSRGPAGGRPLTMILLFASLFVAMVTNLGKNQGGLASNLRIESVGQFRPNGQPVPRLDDVMQGEVWRLITPIFLHFGLLHLVFNMFWLYDLGGMIETRIGTWRFALLVLVSAAVSNLGQLYATGPLFGGMSGVVYALLGYAWMKTKFDPQSGIYVQPSTVFILVGWFLLTASGALGQMIGGVANVAHGLGLGVGIAWGYLASLGRR